MAYNLPQVQVFQMFRQLPKAVVKNLNAFVFGPHFQLYRYSETAEKEQIGIGAYINDDTTYAWTDVNGLHPAGSIVDTAYVKVFGEDVLAEYLAVPADPAYAAQVNDADARNKIRFGGLVVKASSAGIRSAALLRDVAIGDRVRFEYTDAYDVTTSGMSKVVGFEAEPIVAGLAEALAAVGNKATKSVTDLTGGTATPFATDAGNTGLFSDSEVYGLGSVKQFAGLLSAGVVNDVVTVTVTVSGAANTARANVSYASGIYSRSNVLIETSDVAEGKIYLGHNMYLEFVADVSEAGTFTAGDVYTVTVNAAFTALTDSDMNTSGTYVGTRDTTYSIEVVRGGLFDRTIKVTAGCTSTTGGTLAVNAGTAFDAWLGGDHDDEYILKCTTGGTLANALFSLTSLNGDDATDISFADAGTAALGNLGLEGTLTLAAGNPVAGDYWVIRVNACRPQVRIRDSAGIDSGRLVTVNDDAAISLGDLGGQLTFLGNGNTEAGTDADGGLCLGDVYFVAALAASEGAVKTIVLADALPEDIPVDTDIAVQLFLVKTGVEISKYRTYPTNAFNWTADADEGIVVYADLAVQDQGWVDGDGNMPWLPVYSANLFVQYRALLTDYADTIHSISDISDVATTLGISDTPDNPLALGVYKALENSGNRAVYFMATPTLDVSAWSTILDRATLSGDVYGFAPLSRDSEVLGLVEAHINALSTETEKRWRIGFFSAKMPVSDPIYTLVSNPGEVEFRAKITLDPATNKYTLVTFVDANGNPSTVTACRDDVKPGDKVRIGFTVNDWQEASYTEYEVKTVLTNNTLRLKAGPATEMNIPGGGLKVEVHHPYTLAEQADAYAAISSGFYNRRIYNVFPSQLSSGGVVMTGEFAAAAVAGLMSSVPPQQPLTNIELNGFDDLPLVYQTFNRTQLNKMAEYGTLIIMQDMVGGPVYIRHQVSTKSQSGNLNETELSIIKNFDSISYYFADRFAPYIGKYNVTPQLLNIIDLVLDDGIAFLGSMTDVGLLGPQLILSQTEIVGIQQHPSLSDRVVATVNLGLPSPFNTLELRLVV